MTDPGAVGELVTAVRGWSDTLQLLVLNASGGLERDRVKEDPNYPMRINRDAQLAFVQAFRPLLGSGSTIVFVTSHWAHLYGRMPQMAAYEPVAASKFAGEQALRLLFADQRLESRLLVVTGDVVEGTVTPKLLERASRGLVGERRSQVGRLPTTADMATAIVEAAGNDELQTGDTVVVGGDLSSLVAGNSAPDVKS